MNKEDKKRGEAILKNWANAKERLIQIQQEIDSIREGFSPAIINDAEKNKELSSVYNELLFELLKEMKEKMQDYKKVEYVINKLEKFEKNVIVYRYRKNYSWDKIAMESHISRTNCFNIKNRIINEVINCI